ncbi:hypothetical protein Hanom_Chr10g00946001 [Helianthus anomalus]
MSEPVTKVMSEPVAKLENFHRGVGNHRTKKLYISKKKLYKTGGSKTYIPKKFYMKRTYITLLSEKFGGSGAPPGPLKATPLVGIYSR